MGGRPRICDARRFFTQETSAFATGCQLEPLLRAGGIWRDVTAVGVLDVLAKVVAALPGATPPVRQLLAQRLRAAGGITWAAIGGEFALPHPSARIALGRDSGTVALLLLRDALTQTGATPDSAPVTRLFFFIAPSPRAHLDLLGRLTRALAQGRLRELVKNAPSDVEIFAAVAAADATTANGSKPTNGGGPEVKR